MELLADAATLLARAHVPPEIQTALAMARLTALRTPDGGVPGIAAGDAFRRLVCRTLAKRWATVLDEATRSSRAGRLRDAALVSLDGRSAWNSMSRALSCPSCARWPRSHVLRQPLRIQLVGQHR